MKIRVFTAALAGLLAAPLLGETLVATIPFPFHVAGANFEPGSYRLTQVVADYHPGVWRIQAEAGEPAALFTICTGVVFNTAPGRGALIFHRYGTRNFLSRIQRPGRDLGLQLAASQLEREMAKAQVLVETASVPLSRESPR